ncbi:MAG: hypothetical protein M3Z05_16055 [Gemmatimonadota bacterium]|nr:hypothetical protein [Gemmatimonadota bacterium]
MLASMQPVVTQGVIYTSPASARHWNAPRPSPALMWALGIVNRWLLFGLPILRRIPLVRDLPVVHGYFWLRSIDLPAVDRATLLSAVNSETVAFLGPNHPEFGADWLVDKEISTIVAPRMASWADRGIVAAAPQFWGMNNLVANDGGEDAKEYSVAWAGRGEGVLLHPEGSVRWTNDAVQTLYPGIAQMALKAADRFDAPVNIVPIVWKYRFVGDISAALLREMRIIERALRLPIGDRSSVASHFHSLQVNVLERQMRQFGYEEAATSRDFFERQLTFRRSLVDQLEARYATESTNDLDKRVARLTSAIRRMLSQSKSDSGVDVAERRTRLKQDLAMAEEAKRLGEFSADVYGTATLTQEQVSESLKRIRDRLMRSGWRNALANMLPRPLGPRVVHVAVPKPLRVMKHEASSLGDYERRLLVLARMRMQRALDDINVRIAPEVGRFAHPNPFSERR